MDKKNQIIFERIHDEAFCSEFFSQVLVAFDALTEHIADGELSNIEWGEKLITLKKKEELIFLSCCDPNTKEKRINDELDVLSDKFFNVYSKVLIEDFKGDREIFANSEKRFLENIKEVID